MRIPTAQYHRGYKRAVLVNYFAAMLGVIIFTNPLTLGWVSIASAGMLTISCSQRFVRKSKWWSIARQLYMASGVIIAGLRALNII